jgi:bifunctional NMN adenylyltransferase/nudix hydrolase
MQPKLPKADVGVLVGRFQVDDLHEAHLDLIGSVVKAHSKVIVFLGLSPCRVTRNNPLDFESRKQMILDHFPTVNVLYIKDVARDEVWSKNLDSQISDLVGPGKSAVIYGGRESCIDGYKGRYTTCELEQESYISGAEIRTKISAEVKADPLFRAGVIWAAYNQYPRSIPTIDVAIWDADHKRLLMARKKEETLFRFIGGFVQCETLEDSARREVEEEAHIEIGELNFLGSHVVDDWRYRREMDKIMTCFFEAEHTFGIPTPDDDIFELRWFEAADLTAGDLVAEHRPLLKMLCEKSKLRFAKKAEKKLTGWSDKPVINL